MVQNYRIYKKMERSQISAEEAIAIIDMSLASAHIGFADVIESSESTLAAQSFVVARCLECLGKWHSAVCS